MSAHKECTTCAAMGFDCRPTAGIDRIECPPEECGTCDYAFAGWEAEGEE